MFSCFAVVTVGRSPSRNQLRQLQNVHHDAVEEKPKRRTRLQRLRSLLQTAQRKWNTNNLRFDYINIIRTARSIGQRAYVPFARP